MIEFEDFSAPAGFEARAVSTAEGWLLFTSPADGDRWLCVGRTDDLGRKAILFDDEQSREDYPKLCALLGAPWVAFETLLLNTAQWQQECLRRMPPQLWRQLDGSSAEEIAEWRKEIETMTSGELFQATLVGDDPQALRN